MNKILKIIIDVLFISIIAILSLYFILRFTEKVTIYKVKTGSMETGIHVNDYIFVVNNASNYNVGDVITFIYDNNFVTHRIIKKDGDKVITKGDANNTEDDEIDVKQIIGKVVYSGGLLNIIVDYKYAIIAVMLMVYLLTCYLNKGEKKVEEVKQEDVKDEEKVS